MKFLTFFLYMLILFVSSTWVYAALPLITPGEAGYDKEKLEAIQEKVDTLYEDGRIPNYVVALAKHGKVFYAAMRGNATLGQPNTAVDLNTVFWLASKSKPIVSTGYWLSR